MKISIYTYSVTRSAGGVFDAVKDLFTSSQFDKLELTFFSYKDEFVEQDIHLWNDLNIQLYDKKAFLYSKQARDSIVNTSADLLHMVALWRYPHLFMLFWKKHRNEPIVCSPHGMLDSWILKSQGKLKRTISKLLFDRALLSVDCYHALCKKELEDIRAYGLKQPVAIIPNGINLSKSHYKIDYKDGKKHLLYLGRLHPKKGVDILLEAIAKMKKENNLLLNDWVVDIVGWDHENSRIKLEKIVMDNSLQQIVIFHGGLFDEKKIDMYAGATAFILPSFGEGLPMTVLEAWSWKLPVVMTSQCNIPEGFDVGAAIKIEHTVESTKEGLEKLFSLSDIELTKIGENGYELVVSQFTWEKSAQKMIELYNWMINGGDKPEFVYE